MRDNALLLRLSDYARNARGTEKQVLSIVLHNPQKLSGMSIYDLAEASGTSTASVVRLCQKFGLSGYKEFQKELTYNLGTIQAYGHQDDISAIDPADSLEQVIQKITTKNISSLISTSHLIRPQQLELVADALYQANQISVFGIGASLLVAKDLQLKMMRVEKSCHVAEDWHSQCLHAQTLKSGDVAIAVSYSGSTREVLKCSQIAQANGALLVAITSVDTQSPLLEMADVVLGIAATELLVRSGAMSSRIAQLNVVDMLYAVYVQKDYESFQQMFIRNRIPKDVLDPQAVKSKGGEH